MRLPSQEQLKEDYTYNPATGEFKKGPHRIGIKIKISNIQYQAQRVIWKYVTGEEPKVVNHINGNKFDNRWSNLTTATKPRKRPTGPYINNSSGYVGVSYVKRLNKWYSYITINHETISCGYHETAELANQARQIYIETHDPNFGKEEETQE